nr:EAL domain-containing protein [Paraburkholderia sp.]
MRRWTEQHLPPMRVAINLSPRQLSQPNLVATMLEIVKAEGVQCEQTMFEITETVAMQVASFYR